MSAVCATAQDAEHAEILEIGKPVSRDIRRGVVHRYQVSTRTGEFFRGSVLQEGISVRVRGLFPDGSKIRGFSGPQLGKKVFRFVAEAPGTYQLELTGLDGGKAEGKYTITLEQVQPMSERLVIPVPDPYVSPRIRTLQSEAADSGALDRFWAEAGKEGTPLVDPIAEDPGHVLATFLWKQSFDTNNVLVLWNPFAAEHPDDYQMHKIEGTNVWYKTLRVPRGARFLYQLSPNDTLTRSPNAQRYATAQADPLNPRRVPAPPDLTKYEVVSIAELPGASPQPWSDPRPGVAKGELHKHTVRSKVLGNERGVVVYTPAGYQKAGPALPLLLLFDADTYQSQVPVPAILDNLIAARKIEPRVAIMVNYPAQEARECELFANPEFAEFVAAELIPWAAQNYGVATGAPARNIVGGLSAGGFAAAYIGLKHSELFGNVLSQSGAFWWSPKGPGGDSEEPNWLAREYAAAPAKPLRFYLEAGLFENDITGGGGQILETNRHLRDVLRAKGYTVAYHEFPGGHDYLTWRGSFADALLELVGR
jgi:enterochelin esterase family protein